MQSITKGRAEQLKLQLYTLKTKGKPVYVLFSCQIKTMGFLNFHIKKPDLRIKMKEMTFYLEAVSSSKGSQ